MSFPTVQGRAVEGSPFREPQVCLGPKFANSTYKFFISGTGTPANVYQNGTLTSAFPITGFVSSDSFGRFPAIYLDPSVIYRVQFFNSGNVQQWQQDPYISQLSTVGTSSLSAFGPKIAVTGEVTLPAPGAGGSGVTLTLGSGTLGITPLRVNGTLAGNSAIIINNSVTTGAQTATFQANNKPGTPPATILATATAAPTGTLTGGNLTAPFTGTTGGNYTVQLSTGQDIFNVTFTNGITAFVTPSTVISGTPTAALSIQTPVNPAGWLPITCDGVQYYTPIWHGSQPFVPLPGQLPAAVGEVIVGQSVNFGGQGLTTVTGGTATPSNWLSPTEVGAGASFWINITKTSGLSGLAFSAAQGSWVSITSSGLTISSNAQATIGGTYQLSTSSSGSPVVANGTITLSNNNGVQSPTYNSADGLVLQGDGSATGIHSGTLPSWFTPTGSSVGAGFFFSVTQTGGAGTFTGISGVTNITNSGLTVSVTGPSGTAFSATGTYTISSDALGATVLGSGPITLTGGAAIQSPSWSGTTPLVLNGNGSATLAGASTFDWLTPNVTNSGAGFWINITRTSGAAGVNFTAAQGSWTNITNGGLTIDMTGFTGDVGTVTLTGTYQISSSSSGTPVLGSGSISLSVNAGSVMHSYPGAASGTETVPTNASSALIEVYGGGAGGSLNSGGQAGGGAAYSALNIAVSGGQTLTYSVSGGGAGATGTGLGSSGGASTVSGTVTGGTVSMTAGGGSGTGSGGSASGGTTNTPGGTGTTSASGAGAGPLGGASTADGPGLPATGNAVGGGGATNGFATQTTTFTTAGAHTITIPSGCSSMTLEIEGGGGGGGGNSGVVVGNGGSSGGRCVSTYAITPANWGQTLQLTCGAVRASTGSTNNNGQQGSQSQVLAFTFTGFTTMTAIGGGGGFISLGGAAAGGTATGGNVTNQTGNTNSAQQAGAAGLTGTFISGLNGASGANHPGGNPTADTATTLGQGAVSFSGGTAQAGAPGLVSFTYS